MRKTSQTCLNTANQHRLMRKQTLYYLRIDNGRTIGTLSHNALITVGILISSSFIDRIMIHHGINISGRNKKPQTRLPELCKFIIIMPVGLRQNSTAVAVCLQCPSYDCTAKGWMIHIGIPAHINKINTLKSLLQHFLSGRW